MTERRRLVLDAIGPTRVSLLREKRRAEAREVAAGIDYQEIVDDVLRRRAEEGDGDRP